MTRAVFLDRDGVINHDTGHLYRIADFRFRDGIFGLCRDAMRLGFALCVVTNQAGIGRGLYTEADFATLTEWMQARFAEQGVTLLAVEHCPYHPEHGIGAYRRESRRRKPAPGMILDAAAEHGLDLGGSVMLGDRATDMQAAAAAGIGLRILLSDDAAEAAAAPAGSVILADGALGQAAHHIARWAAPAEGGMLIEQGNMHHHG